MQKMKHDYHNWPSSPYPTTLLSRRLSRWSWNVRHRPPANTPIEQPQCYSRGIHHCDADAPIQRPQPSISVSSYPTMVSLGICLGVLGMHGVCSNSILSTLESTVEVPFARYISLFPISKGPCLRFLQEWLWQPADAPNKVLCSTRSKLWAFPGCYVQDLSRSVWMQGCWSLVLGCFLKKYGGMCQIWHILA